MNNRNSQVIYLRKVVPTLYFRDKVHQLLYFARIASATKNLKLHNLSKQNIQKLEG